MFRVNLVRTFRNKRTVLVKYSMLKKFSKHHFLLHGDSALEFRTKRERKKKKERRACLVEGQNGVNWNREERTTQDTKKDFEVRLLVEHKRKMSLDPVPVSP